MGDIHNTFVMNSQDARTSAIQIDITVNLPMGTGTANIDLTRACLPNGGLRTSDKTSRPNFQNASLSCSITHGHHCSSMADAAAIAHGQGAVGDGSAAGVGVGASDNQGTGTLFAQRYRRGAFSQNAAKGCTVCALNGKRKTGEVIREGQVITESCAIGEDQAGSVAFSRQVVAIPACLGNNRKQFTVTAESACTRSKAASDGICPIIIDQGVLAMDWQAA